WPEEFRTHTPEYFQELCQNYQEEIDWHIFLQFLCDLQLHEVKLHATRQKVNLMGDIPILISPDSADVWLHRNLFNLEFAAGAPPDFFNLNGQYWGFPIYNWEEISKHDSYWWIQRLKYASRYYHIYRIDHIVGFFRIWAIPIGLSGTEGHF